MTAFVVPTTFTAQDKYSGTVRAMANATSTFAAQSRASLASAERGFRKLMLPIDTLNNKLRGIGAFIGLYTLFRVIKNGINVIADFQQANVDLAVVMGTTAIQNKILAEDARRIGLNYGESATNVVKMQHALATLGFEQKDILSMGRPLITGSSALEGANPEKLAETVGALINSFDKLESKDTQHILDVMTLAANKTALTFEKLAITLPIVSAPANAVNISLEETTALLGVLADAGVHVATSATSLKNIFIDSAKKGHSYDQVLDNIIKHSDKLTYANKKFGKRSVVSALILAQKLHDPTKGVESLTKQFQNVKLGLTNDIAAQRLDTFNGALKMVSASYQEFILSLEDGTGKYASIGKGILQTVSAMILLSSNSDQAREAISKMNPVIVQLAQQWLGWISVIWSFIKVILYARAVLFLMRIATMAITAVQWGFSIAMGISTALTKGNIFALRGNMVALRAMRLTTIITTASQWGLNIAMYASPLVIFAAGILGVIGVMKLMDSWISGLIKKFDTFSGAMGDSEQKFPSFYMDSNSYFKDKAYETDPFYNKPHDNAFYKKQLSPYAFGNAFASDGMNDFRNQRNLEDYESKNLKLNPKMSDRQSLTDHINNNNLNNSTVTLEINDPGGNVGTVKSDSKSIVPVLNSTMEPSDNFGNKSFRQSRN